MARRPNSSRVTVLEFNTVVGIMGVVLAGWLLPLAGFVLVGDIVAEIINAVIGEVILLAVIGFFKKGLRPTSEPKPQLNATIYGATSLRPCRFPGDVSRLTICVEGLLNLRQASPSLAFAAPGRRRWGTGQVPLNKSWSHEWITQSWRCRS